MTRRVTIPLAPFEAGQPGSTLTAQHLGLLVALHLQACTSPRQVALQTGVTVSLERGDVLLSQRGLGDALGLTRKAVRCGLDALRRTGLVEVVGGAHPQGPPSLGSKGPPPTIVRLRHFDGIEGPEEERGPPPEGSRGPPQGPSTQLHYLLPSEEGSSKPAKKSPSKATRKSDQPSLPKLALVKPVEKAPGSPAGEPAVGTVRWVVSTFCDAWAARRGGLYPPVWARDGAHAKRLLGFQGATPDEIRTRMVRFFERMAVDPWLRENASFPLFVNKWATLDGGKPPPTRPARREFLGLDAEGRPTYREA